MEASSGDEKSIEITLYVCNSLSLAGSLFIITIYLVFTSIRSYALKLVFYMSISDSIRCIGYLIPIDSDFLCVVQGFLTNFGSLSGILWTSIIAFCIYCVVVLDMENIPDYENFMVLIGYILPFFVALLPFTTDSYGFDEGWCWVKRDQYRILWMIFGFYLFVFIVILFNSVMYYKVIKDLRIDIDYLSGTEHEIREKKAIHNRFSFYPLIIVLCYTPVFIKRVLELATNQQIFALTLVSAIMMSIVGLLNAVVYGLTENVKALLLRPFSRRSQSTLSQFTSVNEGVLNDSRFSEIENF